MKFAILNVILWPKNRTFKPRVVSFDPEKVNVITGASRTGKSALIPIIDYCLASGTCTIPEGVIRESCSWFGITVETENQQILLARREPSDSQQTGDMYVLQGAEIIVPDQIVEKNANTDFVKQLLNETAGLSNLGTSDFDNSRPSFRDILKLSFQPQNIVANRDVLFYKASSLKHREKLSAIFPYVLGAITPDIMRKQAELDSLSKELSLKEKELKSIRTIAEAWQADIQAKLSIAVDLGLIAPILQTEKNWTTIVRLLRNVVSQTKLDFTVSSEQADALIDELVAIQQEEARLSNELAVVKRRMTEMSKLRATASSYSDTVAIQRDRLGVSEWLANQVFLHNKVVCPTCNQHSRLAQKEVLKLITALRETELSVSDLSYAQASFDREFESARLQMRKLTELVNAIKIKREQLENHNRNIAESQNAVAIRARFIGRIEEGLHTYENIGEDSKLAEDLAILKERIESLKKQIDSRQISVNKERALMQLSMLTGSILPKLDCSEPNDPVKLSINDLTLRVSRANRTYYLWEIGSGSNWLSYHVSIHLALQMLCKDLKNSPVPSFIVFDQPTQVYFPNRNGNIEVGGIEPILRDEDMEAVRKLFITLNEVVKNMDGLLQIIVMDHAPSSIWADLDSTVTAETWRDDKLLVPRSWYSSENE